ncbi:MAG: nucleotidyl transferase AbiEii/AbiGii toxin family protein [Thermoanaerobaculia bacterium]
MTHEPLQPRAAGALAPESRALLARVAERPWARDVYLAGSAALALYLDHRPVRDLDLMSASHRLASSERRDLLADVLSFDPEARVETARDGYLSLATGPGPLLRLYYYPYPLVDPETEAEGLAVASAVDLGLMKLGAVISRGTKRDFVDLYLLCRRLPLATLLERSPEKYGHVRDFPLQALKGLADRSLTTGEPMPRLSSDLEWAQVEDWVDTALRDLAPGASRTAAEGRE